jgi:hypothetical protein
LGEGPTAALLQQIVEERPARVPLLPWPHAGRRVAHPGVGDPPDPHPPPYPCGARDPRRREEPPSDAGPASRGTARAPRRSADAPRITGVRPRGPATTRGPVAWVAVSPRRSRGPAGPGVTRPDRRPNGPRGAQARRERGGGHAAANRAVLARSVTAPYARVTPIQFPILDKALTSTSPSSGSRWRWMTIRRLVACAPH